MKTTFFEFGVIFLYLYVPRIAAYFHRLLCTDNVVELIKDPSGAFSPLIMIYDIIPWFKAFVFRWRLQFGGEIPQRILWFYNYIII